MLGLLRIETPFGADEVMTVIVINAVSVKEGGSLVVLQNLLINMVHLRPEWQWHVVTNSTARLCLPDLQNTILHVIHLDQ